MTRIVAGGMMTAAALLLVVPALPAGADTLPPAGCDTKVSQYRPREKTLYLADDEDAIAA